MAMHLVSSQVGRRTTMTPVYLRDDWASIYPLASDQGAMVECHLPEWTGGQRMDTYYANNRLIHVHTILQLARADYRQEQPMVIDDDRFAFKEKADVLIQRARRAQRYDEHTWFVAGYEPPVEKMHGWRLVGTWALLIVAAWTLAVPVAWALYMVVRLALDALKGLFT
jgi:hypothetical protein